MSRFLFILLLIVLVIGGGLYLLAGIDTEQPQTRVEKAVPSDKLGK